MNQSNEQWRKDAHQKDLQRLRGFRPIDDTFMRGLFRENLPDVYKRQVIKLAKKSVIDIPTAVICIAVALLSIVTDLSPIVFVISAGFLGVVIQSLKAKGAKS